MAIGFSIGACEPEKPPAFSYYDDRIAPVLSVGCVEQTTGCHVASDRHVAVGNLDLSSYDALLDRQDVLTATGPYPVGQLLLKGGDPVAIAVQTFDPPNPKKPKERFVAITTDIRHAGGALLVEGSEGYAAIKQWIEEGHTQSGEVHEVVNESRGACRSGAGAHPGFDPEAKVKEDEAFFEFISKVQPTLVRRCAGSGCHGNPTFDLYLSCGKTEAEKRWNYFAALAHVDRTSSLSELLRRPLSKLRGGTYHEGGTIFADTDDEDYRVLRTWIEHVNKQRPELVAYEPDDEGLRFFGNYVQPLLVQKGCMFQNCHSPAMFHDLRLRGGSEGTFSRIAFDRNYDMSRRLLALESENPNDSRIIAKNLFTPEQDPEGRGISHRGGALFEDFTGLAQPELCAGIDVTKGRLSDVPAYCVMVAWHALERRLAIERGELDDGRELPLVWVARPPGTGDVRDFDTYRPGAELLAAALTLADGAGPPSLGPATSLNAACGLSTATADIRGPAASWDGSQLAFAARSSADQPFRLYTSGPFGEGCAPLAAVAPAKREQSGILLHDFDPAFAPDGRLVFASVRGPLGGDASYSGPTRTRSTLAPNANLYVYDFRRRDLRQLTFLSNQELMPSFMGDGRVIFTTEKREPGFFQLAARRQNLDGGDYHPLFAQRGSIGFELATEVVELPNRNLALVAAPVGAADGAGTIAIVNRSIGPDQDDRDPKDAFYVHALSFPRPGAFDGAAGVFRSPAPLPSHWLVVSCDREARRLATGGFAFGLCALDPASGELTTLFEDGRAHVEAAAVYARAQHGVFASRPDEVNGHTRVIPGESDAEVLYNDFPLLATLLFSNTRVGRPIDERILGFEVLESLPAPASARTFADLDGDKVFDDAFGKVFADYRSLGKTVLQRDGSAKVRLPGGHAFVLRILGKGNRPLEFGPGAPFKGEMITREENQFYPGERAHQSLPRQRFDGLCGGCHGSVTGFETDVAVDVDVLTHASEVEARDARATDLTR